MVKTKSQVVGIGLIGGAVLASLMYCVGWLAIGDYPITSMPAIFMKVGAIALFGLTGIFLISAMASVAMVRITYPSLRGWARHIRALPLLAVAMLAGGAWIARPVAAATVGISPISPVLHRAQERHEVQERREARERQDDRRSDGQRSEQDRKTMRNRGKQSDPSGTRADQ